MIRRLILLAVIFVLHGCIPVPIPTKASAPRYTESELGALEVGGVDREGVRRQLGSPALTRAQDRLWVYLWTVQSGEWFAIPLAPLIAGNMGPMHEQQFALFLEFDTAGMLRDRAYGNARKGEPADRFCTPDDVCLEHQVTLGTEVGTSGRALYGFADDWSVVSVPNRGARPRLVEAPRPEECTVTLWPEEGWARPLHSLWWADPPGGVPMALDPETGEPRYHWVRADQVLELGVAAGTHTVQVIEPRSSPDALRHWQAAVSSATFDCTSGEHVYLEVGATIGAHQLVQLPIVLRRVDPAVASVLTASRRLVVPR